MASKVAAEPIPLATGEDGVIRVTGTRVTLDTVIDAFKAGTSPEEIAQDFPVLRLDDTYAVLTYYLRHREEVEAYLQERRARGAALRREVETLSSQEGLRSLLLARLLPS